MNALKEQFKNAGALQSKAWRLLALAVLGSVCAFASAQENAIESITANQQGANVIVKVTLKNPLDKPPIGFSMRGIMTPWRKRVTRPLLAETTTAMQSAAREMAAAALCRLPKPPGRS